MPELKNSFFEGILFRYETSSCDCVEETIHTSKDAAPQYCIKLQAIPSEKKSFAYAAQQGLVRIAKNGSIEESNILGRLMSLPSKPKKELFSFISDNGFLFPVSQNNYESFDEGALLQLIERLKIVVELMTEINLIKKDYDKIVCHIISLLFAPDLSINTESMAEAYHTYHHPIKDILDTASIELSDERKQEAFDGNTFAFNDSVYSNYSLDVEEYQNIVSGYSSTPGFSEPLFKALTGLYMNYQGEDSLRRIIDFLFHYFHEVSVIKQDLTFYTKPSKKDLTKELKEAMIDVAKLIIGEEINANLTGIHPIYDSHKMTPSWKVDSLLCAAYFSIFYLNPELELYRPCQNPRCGRYFLVKATSTRVRYCSTACCNRVTQDRYRKKQRGTEI